MGFLTTTDELSMLDSKDVVIVTKPVILRTELKFFMPLNVKVMFELLEQVFSQ